MKNIADKLSKIHTDYLWINPRKCESCWKCIKVCPKQVIGKVGILWHRHIIVKNAENCIGCKKCIHICPHEVFSEEMPDIFKVLLTNKR